MLDTFFSLGLILLLGFLAGFGLSKIPKVKIPGLTGMIIVGMIIGPSVLGLLSDEVMAISAVLRKIALVVILTRSGLNLDIESLKKVGRPAILMCFLPATFEIAGVTLGGYFFLHLSLFEAMLLGSVLAAVSPAVVSPRMIRLIEGRWGEEHAVAKMILAGSSCDDIYVIVLFYCFLGLVENQSMDFVSLLSIPVSIVLGIALGLCVGFLLSFVIKHAKLKNTGNILLILSSSFIMIGIEALVTKLCGNVSGLSWLAVSSLLGIVVVGMVVLFKLPQKAKEISGGYNAIWSFFEILLFVLVGAEVDLSYAVQNAGYGLLVLGIGLCFRMMGVFVCLLGTPLTKKERLFSVIAYIPKATVQASIGGIALAQGLGCGAIILTVAVLSILITAPVGAFLIDMLYKRLLTQTKDDPAESLEFAQNL